MLVFNVLVQRVTVFNVSIQLIGGYLSDFICMGIAMDRCQPMLTCLYVLKAPYNERDVVSLKLYDTVANLFANQNGKSHTPIGYKLCVRVMSLYWRNPEGCNLEVALMASAFSVKTICHMANEAWPLHWLYCNYYIRVETKWLQFCKYCFGFHFLVWQFLYFDSNFTAFSQWPN